MKVVISEDTIKFYGNQIKALDPTVEIFSLNPENPNSPSWVEDQECDIFFLSYQFLFAVRDHEKTAIEEKWNIIYFEAYWARSTFFELITICGLTPFFF